MKEGKTRLDQVLVQRHLAESRQRAQALIMAGNILVDGVPVDKPGAAVTETAGIVLRGEPMPYVSRGGLKLEAALSAWPIAVKNRICLDVGASTGGFTDCLLQNGAAHVYAVDVGYGQLAWRLRQDPRVTAIERTNVRHLSPDTLPSGVDLVTIDTSFISLATVVPAVLRFVKSGGDIIALIKPQFEVGKGKVGKGGVVRSPALHREVIETLSCVFSGLGLGVGPVIPSPILGPKGNREYLIHLKAPEPSGQ